MAVSLDDDVPLILTLDETESAPLAPSKGLGQEEQPSKSKRVGGPVGGQLRACLFRERWWVGFSLREMKDPVTHLKGDTDFALR